MADQPNGNGIKALAAAVAIGALTGSVGTYKVADDYTDAVCALRIDNAVNADRIENLKAMQRRRMQ